MSSAADADLTFVCAELMEISVRINAMHAVLVGDPKDIAIKTEMDTLGAARSELRKRLRDMQARSMRGLRAKSELQVVFLYCTGRDAVDASALRRVREILRGNLG